MLAQWIRPGRIIRKYQFFNLKYYFIGGGSQKYLFFKWIEWKVLQRGFDQGTLPMRSYAQKLSCPCDIRLDTVYWSVGIIGSATAATLRYWGCVHMKHFSTMDNIYIIKIWTIYYFCCWFSIMLFNYLFTCLIVSGTWLELDVELCYILWCYVICIIDE